MATSTYRYGVAGYTQAHDCFIITGDDFPRTGGINLANEAGILYHGLMDWFIPDLPTITAARITLSATDGWREGGDVTPHVSIRQLLRTDWVEAEATGDHYKTGSAWTTSGANGAGADIDTTDLGGGDFVPVASGAVEFNFNSAGVAVLNAARDGIVYLKLHVSGAGAWYQQSGDKENEVEAMRPLLTLWYADDPPGSGMPFWCFRVNGKLYGIQATHQILG